MTLEERARAVEMVQNGVSNRQGNSWGVRIRVLLTEDKQNVLFFCFNRRIYRFNWPTMEIELRFQGFTEVDLDERALIYTSRKQILCKSKGKSNLKVYDAETGQVVAILKTDQKKQIENISVNSKGTIACASTDEGPLLVYDLEEMKYLYPIDSEEYGINMAIKHNINPSGTKVAFSVGEYLSRKMIIWDIKKAKEVGLRCDLENEDSNIEGLYPLDDDRYIATCRDHILRVYNINTGELLQRLKGHTSPTTLALNKNSPYILSHGYITEEECLRIWDKQTYQCVSSYTLDKTMDGINWSTDGRYIVTTNDRKNSVDILRWTIQHGHDHVSIVPEEYYKSKKLTPEFHATDIQVEMYDKDTPFVPEDGDPDTDPEVVESDDDDDDDDDKVMYEETEWIRNNIKRRECSSFAPTHTHTDKQNISSDHVYCQCGYIFGDHMMRAKESKNQTKRWDSDTHTTKEPTNAFGEMEFVGYGGNVAKYIRVDENTSTQDMLVLLMEVWGMDKPNLVVSVTGDAQRFRMNKRLKETLRRGLMKTAKATDTWIITGGNHAGVMKLVGEAVRECGIASTSKNPVIAIGIAPWGCVHNKDVLINDNTKLPARYSIEKEQRSDESCLDPNHSYFILVDNGTQHKFGVEIQFRALLENEVATIKTETGKHAVSVPIVLLVFEGGLETLETVNQSLDNNTPVVIMKGSGRAADILAYAYQKCIESDNDAQDHEGKNQKTSKHYMVQSVEEEVKKMVEKEFAKKDPSEHNKIMSRINDCLNKYDLISVFDLDNKASSNELDVSMLQALLKANKNNVRDQLRLGLAWNRIDVAKSDIFTDDKHLDKKSLDDVMFSAIQLNRVDFVELFLDHGVSIREFLTKERLLLLYNETPQKCLLRSMLAEIQTKKDPIIEIMLEDVGLLMQELLGDYYRPYTTMAQYDRDILDDPIEELFIWAVLMIRQDMAKLFWAEGKDAIAAALVANGLLRAMKESIQDTAVIIKIQENMDEWSSLAIDVLSECYSTNEKKAQDLLVRKLHNWGNSTCMVIAEKSVNKDFISQSACQSLLNRIWMGKMIQTNSTFKLLVCMFFPPLMLWCVAFQSDKGDALAMDNSKVQKIQEPHVKLLRRRVQVVGANLFYFFRAPVIIFMYNVISYLVFLMLFSYVLIFNFGPKVSSAEIILIIWVFTIFTEEIRQVAMTTPSSLRRKFKNYITDTLNVVDIITIVLFGIGMILRVLPYPNTIEAARVILALNFVSFFLRLLHIFSVHKELGPKLVMIGGMMQDLMYFVVILMVFVVSYAIASHSVLFPNSPVHWNTIVSIIRRAYWNIYGELFLDEIEGDSDCTFDEMLWTNGTYPRCPTNVGRIVVPIMMGVYMLLANVLLLNLLIAMFSHTFQKIQSNTDTHWSYQRYSLIYEFYTRPVLCPPLILFFHFHLIIKFLWSRCVCKTAEPLNNEDDFCRFFENEHKLIHWEKHLADAFHHKPKLTGSESMEYNINSTHDRMRQMEEAEERRTQDEEGRQRKIKEAKLEKYRLKQLEDKRQREWQEKNEKSLRTLINRIDEIQVHQATMSATSPTLDIRLLQLETQMANTSKSLDLIVAALQKSHGIQDVTMAALPDSEEEDVKKKAGATF